MEIILCILILILVTIGTIIVIILNDGIHEIKEGAYMNNVIEIVPDKDGKLFITLYGTKYQIVVKNKPVEPVKKIIKEDKE